MAARLKEDVENATTPDETEESPATYKGAYLIISNRHDVLFKTRCQVP